MIKTLGMFTNTFIEIQEERIAIQESILHVLSTNPGERQGNPEFGSYVRDYLFEREDVLQEDIEEEIIRALRVWEPRVTITKVEIAADETNKELVRIKIFGKYQSELDEEEILNTTFEV